MPNLGDGDSITVKANADRTFDITINYDGRDYEKENLDEGHALVTQANSESGNINKPGHVVSFEHENNVIKSISSKASKQTA
jgi:hypothetical protein